MYLDVTVTKRNFASGNLSGTFEVEQFDRTMTPYGRTDMKVEIVMCLDLEEINWLEKSKFAPF